MNTEPENSVETFDPFNPEDLRIDPSYLSHPPAKKLLTTVPVRKPHKQDFVRVHSGPEFRLTTALIELHDEREVYLVTKQVAPELDGELFAATIYLCMNRQKIVSLWPVKLPTADGRQLAWHTSAAEAAERAMSKWIKMTADMSLGAYAIYEAVGDFGEPEWPQLTFKEILRIAFKGRLIETPDHLVIKKLRGLV